MIGDSPSRCVTKPNAQAAARLAVRVRTSPDSTMVVLRSVYRGFSTAERFVRRRRAGTLAGQTPFFAYAWLVYPIKEPHPEGLSRISRTPSGATLTGHSSQGYAQNAYPWVNSLHRSAVPSDSRFFSAEQCAIFNRG